MQKMKLDHCLIPCTKINSKCINELYLRAETIKLPEEKVVSKLLDVGLSNIFFWTSFLSQGQQKLK